MEYVRKLLQYLKKFFNRENKKKSIENAVVIVIIGVIIIIAGSTFFGGGSKDKSTAGTNGTAQDTANNKTLGNISSQSDKDTVERRVEDILSKVSGAGKVDVMVTYVSGNEQVPAYDTKNTQNNTQEKDSSGGVRQSTQSDAESSPAFQNEQGGGQKPIIIMEKLPQVKGVVVVADGANNDEVKQNLRKAIQVLMGISTERILVLESGKK
jgi:stage III sporulation protein AG